MAKLTAWLGLDGKNFNLGVDGAKKKVNGLKKELQGIKAVGTKALAFFGLSASLGAIQGLVNYAQQLRETAGISIIDNENLDTALGVMEGLRASFGALIGEVLSVAGKGISMIPGMGGEGEGNVFADLTKDLRKSKEERKKMAQDQANFEKLTQDKNTYIEQQRLKRIEKEQGLAALTEELLRLQEETTGFSVEAARRRFELEKQIDDVRARRLAEEEAATKEKLKEEEAALKKKKQQDEKAADINAKAQQKIEDVKNKEFTSRFAAADELTKMGGGMRLDPMIAVRDRQLQVLEDIRDIQEETQREIERLSRGEE